MRRDSKTILVTIILLLATLTPGRADSPLPPPTRQTIWSANRRFFAVMDPDTQITTVYRAREVQGEKLWSMYGWFRVAALADDGDHLVAGYWGVNLIPLDYNKKEVMLYFFKRGELINHITLDLILRDFSKLTRGASHYHWGNYEGFDRAGLYVVTTVEGRRMRFDVTRGMLVAEAEAGGKGRSGKSVTPNP